MTNSSLDSRAADNLARFGIPSLRSPLRLVYIHIAEQGVHRGDIGAH